MNIAFLYEWSDKINNMLYVGSHKGDPEDDYICSSKSMLVEHNERPKDFSRKILCIGKLKYIRELETNYLKNINAANNSEYYNKSNTYPYFERTKETIEKISKKLLGKNNPNYGKPRSDETKRKISEAQIGKIISKEIREKISKGNKGKIVSKETRRKLSISMRGHKGAVFNHTDEAKRKITEANKSTLKKQISHILKDRNKLIYKYDILGRSYRSLAKNYNKDHRIIKKVIEGYYCEA